MVLFPEGGFLCKRRETSQKYAKKNNLPILENVTLPRVGAMQTIFETLGPAMSKNTEDQQLNSRPSKFYLYRKRHFVLILLNSIFIYLYDIHKLLCSLCEQFLLICDKIYYTIFFVGMTVAKPEISWVLDITIAYPQGKPIDLPTIITGSRPPCETVLFYRLFPSSVVSINIKLIVTHKL